MIVSVVVPTFARNEAVLQNIAALAASELEGFERLEIIVVDDGSPMPVQPMIESIRRPVPNVSIRTLRQSNQGPAAARNNGFRAASGDTVVFVDDDIRVGRGLVSSHVLAHRAHPHSVIFGRCVLPEYGDPILRRVLDTMAGDPGGVSSEEYEPCMIAASGQLSVQRADFSMARGVYSEDLRTPAAEEYELSARLKRAGISVVRANRIVGVHRTQVTLHAVCGSQYTHGRGCSEAAMRAPETLSLPQLRAIIEAHETASLLKRLARSQQGRYLLKLAALTMATALAQQRVVELLYRWAIGASFAAGIREGLLEFGPVKRA